ncbi:hypothetical protein ymoll0001_12740 [Yersinia mollaretii ATCC 43969]|uniref:Uncharacterized protein n=1 Tax=Yersinia mollaretii (strain ATCC 43969 / DSM 18520 / CIP 103324 / CNY 7263 / WAIP 204) TaxID=349967 RepID=A0ABM9Y8W7_YERMW|nr:hypothetical protein ymoll0001_12740 [Yersinia mollaretii ATCC 43969]
MIFSFECLINNDSFLFSFYKLIFIMNVYSEYAVMCYL